MKNLQKKYPQIKQKCFNSDIISNYCKYNIITGIKLSSLKISLLTENSIHQQYRIIDGSFRTETKRSTFEVYSPEIIGGSERLPNETCISYAESYVNCFTCYKKRVVLINH